MDKSWVESAEGSLFGIENLPYCSFREPAATTEPDAAATEPDAAASEPAAATSEPAATAGGARTAGARLGVRIGNLILDLGAAAAGLGQPDAGVLASPDLNALMAAGPECWARVRESTRKWLSDPRLGAEVEQYLRPVSSVELVLPFEVADYVDFYSSVQHATNAGRIFRPDSPALPPAWKHLPIGYHGRAGTVVVSGTPVRRPSGLRKAPPAADPLFGPSLQLDFEAEVGFVVGVGSERCRPLTPASWTEHVFGVVLVNDWSARDVQAFEAQPLGPFLGKSFLTSVSPYVVPLEALGAALCDPPPRDPPPPAHLDDSVARSGLDITLEVSLEGRVISRPPFRGMYWTAAQQLAHLTSNGASLRTGDLFASGTVSGEDHSEWGSLLELAWRGEHPIELGGGRLRSFLEDGDTLSITATAPGMSGTTLGFGEVAGTVVGR